jgi:rod shape-determining protein MreC
VLTSGGDQVYPRGLPVGTIESIAPDPDHNPYTAIVVRPAVNLARVEEVLVITGTQAALPSSAEQDLAAAAVQHAADLSAERLPSIHDDQPPGAPDANAATPGSPTTSAAPVTPHPLPALHPDRFTPGAVPPAAEMTPGAPNSSPREPPPQNGQAPASGSEPKNTQQPSPAKPSPPTPPPQ